MALEPTGYGTPLPTDVFGDADKTTKCDLKIPYKDAPNTLAAQIAQIEGVTEGQAMALKVTLGQIAKDFEVIEQWAGYFLRNCICHCEDDGGT